MYKQEYLSVADFTGYVHFEQVKSQNFYESHPIWLHNSDRTIFFLMSYNTIVACVDCRKNVLYHFGKGYSRTTSKQLTQYINENRNKLFSKVIYLDSTYNFEKFKIEYMEIYK